MRGERAAQLTTRRVDDRLGGRRPGGVVLLGDLQARERAGRVLMPAVDRAQEGVTVVRDRVRRDLARGEHVRGGTRALAESDDGADGRGVSKRRGDEGRKRRSTRGERELRVAV